MKLIVWVLLGLLVLLYFAGLLRPDLVFGKTMLNRNGFWTILGMTFSYLGFVFSVSALLEVRDLTSRYFTKQRLPEIQKSIEKISKEVLAFAEKDISEARAQKFVGNIPVMVRQVEKLGVSEFMPIARRLEEAHLTFQKAITDKGKYTKAANDVDSFWRMHQALSELTDEISEYNKGAMATL